MNALAAKYGDKLNILAFPCNQFGHQTNENNAEFLNTLKYVRPGSGFEPASSIEFFEKGDVNGSNAQPVWQWLRTEVMIPKGDKWAEHNGQGFSAPEKLDDNPIWFPVSRSDVAWNFEKFLLNPNGEVTQRYSKFSLCEEIEPDIDAMLA